MTSMEKSGVWKLETEMTINFFNKSNSAQIFIIYSSTPRGQFRVDIIKKFRSLENIFKFNLHVLLFSKPDILSYISNEINSAIDVFTNQYQSQQQVTILDYELKKNRMEAAAEVSQRERYAWIFHYLLTFDHRCSLKYLN